MAVEFFRSELFYLDFFLDDAGGGFGAELGHAFAGGVGGEFFGDFFIGFDFVSQAGKRISGFGCDVRFLLVLGIFFKHNEKHPGNGM